MLASFLHLIMKWISEVHDSLHEIRKSYSRYQNEKETSAITGRSFFNKRSILHDAVY